MKYGQYRGSSEVIKKTMVWLISLFKTYDWKQS